MQTITSADGTRIAYERDGTGTPLVLFHGGGTHRYWDPLRPHLPDGHTLVLPDRRGRGESGDADAYSIQREVEDARALIEAVDGDPVVVGHSFGGLQAIEAARDASVEAVVAYEPAYLVGAHREAADLAAQMRERLDAGQPREAMKLHLREVLRGGDVEDFDAWLEDWAGWPACVEYVENTVRMDAALETHELADSLDIDAPALLLTGTAGPQHLRDSIRSVHEALDHSRLVEFSGVGHLGPAAAPARVAAELRAFLGSREVAERPA